MNWPKYHSFDQKKDIDTKNVTKAILQKALSPRFKTGSDRSLP